MAYELKTNTVVDALNEIHASLAGESAGKEADTILEALNNVSVDLGGSVHTLAPDAIRDIGEHMSSGGGSGESGYSTCTVTIKNIGYTPHASGGEVYLNTVTAIANYGAQNALLLQPSYPITINNDPDSSSEYDVDIVKNTYTTIQETRSVYNDNDVYVRVLEDSVILSGHATGAYSDVFMLSPAYSVQIFIPESFDSNVTLIVGSDNTAVHNYTE